MTRRGRARAAVSDVPFPPAALCVSVRLDSFAGDLLDHLKTACPVQLEQLGDTQTDAAAALLQLRMESWQHLPQVLAWFVGEVLPAHATAQLTFDPALPKQLRADVHTRVSKKHGKAAETLSEGFGEDRHVAVVAKGRGRNARSFTSEQADHALALWLLHKEQARQQQQQQQQQPSGAEQLQQQQEQPQQQPADGDLASSLQQQLELCHEEQEPAPAAGTTQQPSSSGLPAAAARGYSRDEVAQMLQRGQLTDELAALWAGPASEAQRQIRLLCLAASAGDEVELQELLACSQPGLVSGAVRDLSSGGQLPLHLAAAAGHTGVLRALLAAGAEPEATNGAGHTALQVAQRCEQCDAEAVLLQAGAVDRQTDSWSGGFASTQPQP